ncbi:unnamed protein product [Cyprideis torosa]|uniref:Uncharacterized protein n=1 Tax=Cyprideis torosa TaxID=163714 RepID=A0A7R8ZTT2_9CRUS|nr:unnamed protein product [Cyprideis torosa]CAG0898722.1 unnamed protein product [Cyprideis torosa]
MENQATTEDQNPTLDSLKQTIFWNRYNFDGSNEPNIVLEIGKCKNFLSNRLLTSFVCLSVFFIVVAARPDGQPLLPLHPTATLREKRDEGLSFLGAQPLEGPILNSDEILGTGFAGEDDDRVQDPDPWRHPKVDETQQNISPNVPRNAPFELSISIQFGPMLQSSSPGEDRRNRIRRRLLPLLIERKRLSIKSSFSPVSLKLLRFLRRHFLTESLSYDVALDVTIVVLESAHEPSTGLQGLSHHIVDQTVLVADPRGLELRLVVSESEDGDRLEISLFYYAHR